MAPFDRLVNITCVIDGYVGIILLGFMIVKTLRVAIPDKDEEGAASA